MFSNFSRPQKLLLAALVAIIVLAIPLSIFISDQIKLKNTNFTIENLDETTTNHLSISERTKLFSLISDTLELDSISDAVIRENTLSEVVDSENNISYTFILDIPSLEQSYVVDYSTDPDIDGFLISCPPIKDAVYDTFCEGMYDNTISATIDAAGSSRIYNSTDPYTVSYDREESGVHYVKVTPTLCDEAILSDLESATRSWLIKIGLGNYNITPEAACR